MGNCFSLEHLHKAAGNSASETSGPSLRHSVNFQQSSRPDNGAVVTMSLDFSGVHYTTVGTCRVVLAMITSYDFFIFFGGFFIPLMTV